MQAGLKRQTDRKSKNRGRQSKIQRQTAAYRYTDEKETDRNRQ